MSRFTKLAAMVVLLGWVGASGAGEIRRAEDLLRLTESQLIGLYTLSPAGCSPRGWVRGLPILDAGTSRGRAISKGARIVWQGKIMHPDSGRAVNRFLGVPIVAGRLGTGPSWLDGRPALVLDYEGTSLVYRNYRDEIRQVAPGVYLGLMYDRTTWPHERVMMFALEDR